MRGPRVAAAASASAVRIADLDLSLPSPSGDEVGALAEAGDLSEGERRRLLALARLVSKRDPWALLGVPKGSLDKDLKRAYFRLSKDIHPDRYYGKQLGSFSTRLASVFEAVARAYAELTSKKAAAAVVARASDEPQTPQAYAQELFDRACHAEVSGDAENAMKLFAAAVRLEPQVRYLRRAASCALLSSQPRTAVEYAKKAASIAPDDPSCARLLAQCFKALGQLDAAEEVLVMAMAIKSENDMLAAELRNDLKDVQRALGRR
nr:DnaJ domain-containing protein [Kofleriaceae bacterium]